jgi:ABC-type sugar transport system ATPase subunit
MNFIPAALVRACPALAAWVPAAAQQVGIRPEHWQVCAAGQGLQMTVRHAEYMGAQRLVHAELADQTRVELLVDGEQNWQAGQQVHMAAAEHHVHVFDAQEQRMDRTAA